MPRLPFAPGLLSPFRPFALILALCCATALFLSPTSSSAADLYILGGGGGAGNEAGSGGGGGAGAFIGGTDPGGHGGDTATAQGGYGAGGLSPNNNGSASAGGWSVNGLGVTGPEVFSGKGGDPSLNGDTGDASNGAAGGLGGIASGTAGGGGGGGGAGEMLQNDFTRDSLTIRGGGGGWGATGGVGAGGGEALLNGNGYDVVLNNNLTVTGGDGGNNGAAEGGAGGAASIRAKNLRVSGTVAITSGLYTAGGAANLTADTLTAPVINLTQNGGAVAFNVTTLDVSGGNTGLNLDGTTAAGVNIGNVALAGGSTFTVTSVNSGGATFNALDLTAGSGELKLDSTSATDVIINAVNLSGSNTFTVTSANSGTGTFTNLNVTGTGGTVTAPATQLFSNVNLAGGSTLAASALNFSTMRIQDRSATYNGNLNAAGKSLIFELPASLTPGQTMLAVTGNADITGATVGIGYQTVRPSIALNDSLTLLDVSGTLTGTETDLVSLTVQTANGDIYTLNVQSNQLLAVLSYISPDTPAYERLKAYAEGRTATLAFVNQGADLILNQGMGSALMSTRGPGFQMSAFAAGQGGWSRYNTGSHVDVSGASMLAGVAIGNDAGPGRITAGLFFEGGWGSYNSYNSFSNYASVDGDGDTNYYGGGILGRYDVTGGALSGLYFDASARMGRASTDFSSGDIRYHGSKADFDSDSMYWGAHAGLGYQWSFTEKAMLDLSGKFIWTRQDGDSVNVHGDRVHFDSADSLRTRLGGRFNYAVCDYATPYVGAYWEHEFDGKQRSTINGVGTGSPDLKGDTGMGELGLTIKPVKDSGFSMDLGVQGYTGVREGVTGSLQLKFEF